MSQDPDWLPSPKKTTVDVDWLVEYLTSAPALQVIEGGRAGERGQPRAKSDAHQHLQLIRADEVIAFLPSEIEPTPSQD